MLRIGDFSKLAQVTVRTLHHYEQLGLLKAKVVDQFTGYRYYDLEQLPRLHRILALKDLGFSLEQIAGLLESDLSPDLMRGMLMAKQAELQQALGDTAARLHRVAARLEQIEHSPDVSEFEIMIKSVPPLPVVSTRSVIPQAGVVGLYCDSHFAEIEAWLDYQGLSGGLTLNLYHNDEYTETDIDMESAVILDELPAHLKPSGNPRIGVQELPAEERMASLVHPLSFDGVLEGIGLLFRWISLNGYQIAGPLREVHLFGPPKAVSSDEEVIMELQIPVTPQAEPGA